MLQIKYLFFFLGSFAIVFISINILRKFTSKRQCPYCGSAADLERIKSASIFKLIPALNAKHFVCYKCNRKHYRIGSSDLDK